MLCLLLTLLVVPVGYSYVEQFQEWLRRRRRYPSRSLFPRWATDPSFSIRSFAFYIGTNGRRDHANLAPMTFLRGCPAKAGQPQIVC